MNRRTFMQKTGLIMSGLTLSHKSTSVHDISF